MTSYLVLRLYSALLVVSSLGVQRWCCDCDITNDVVLLQGLSSSSSSSQPPISLHIMRLAHYLAFSYRSYTNRKNGQKQNIAFQCNIGITECGLITSLTALHSNRRNRQNFLALPRTAAHATAAADTSLAVGKDSRNISCSLSSC